MTDSDQIIITATMLGYMAGLADREHANPYSYMQTEAWSWQHGYEQGRLHRARSEIRDAPKHRDLGRIEFLQSPKPSTAMENLVNWMARRMHERNHLRMHEWAKKQLAEKTA